MSPRIHKNVSGNSKSKKDLQCNQSPGRDYAWVRYKIGTSFATSPNPLIRRGIFYPQTIAGGHALSWDSLCFSGKVASESKEYWFRYFPKSCITQKMKYTIN